MLQAHAASALHTHHAKCTKPPHLQQFGSHVLASFTSAATPAFDDDSQLAAIPIGHIPLIVTQTDDHIPIHGSSSNSKILVESLQADPQVWPTQFTKFSWAYQRDLRYLHLARDGHDFDFQMG